MTLPVWQGLAAREENTDIVALESPTVTVTNEATGGQPNLFSDRAGNTALGNPFTADANGKIEFYVAPGRYKVEASKGGDTVTWDNQIIGTLHGIDSPADGERPEYDNANDRWVSRQAGYLDPEHATDGSSPADDYDSATNTTVPGDGVRITRDFQSANTTTTPTLDSKTITDRDGNALWASAINGVHELQYASGTDTYLLLDPNERKVRAVGVLARHQNLVITNNATNPNFQVDIDADELEVYDTNGIPRVLTSVDLTVDITASGANGLDTGSEASDTWYHLWVIYNGTTVAGLLSTASSFGSLTLPSGYSYAGYVGAIYNNASSNFITLRQLNERAEGSLSTDLSGGTSSDASVSVRAPTTANGVELNTTTNETSGSNGTRNGHVGPTSSLRTARRVGGVILSSGSVRQHVNVPLIESQTVHYGVGSNTSLDLETSGWYF